MSGDGAATEERFWSILRESYEGLGYRQSDVTTKVAAEVGVSHSTVRDWLSRRIPPTERELFALLRACGVVASSWQHIYSIWTTCRLDNGFPAADAIAQASPTEAERLVQLARDWSITGRMADAQRLSEQIFHAKKATLPTLACKAGIDALGLLCYQGRRDLAMQILPTLTAVASAESDLSLSEVQWKAAIVVQPFDLRKSIQLLEENRRWIAQRGKSNPAWDEVRSNVIRDRLGAAMILLPQANGQVKLLPLIQDLAKITRVEDAHQRELAYVVLAGAYSQIGALDLSQEMLESAGRISTPNSAFLGPRIELTRAEIETKAGMDPTQTLKTALAKSVQLGFAEYAEESRRELARFERG